MHRKKDITLEYQSEIENIDIAIFNWFEKLELSCTTNTGWKKVPVLWVSPERAFRIKSGKDFIDGAGTINPPFISIERTSISRDVAKNGVFFANVPPKDTNFVVSRKINQDKTDKFTNAYAKRIGFSSPKKKIDKVVYEFKTMRMPTYANFTYSISIMAQYQQQMNEIIQPFLTMFGTNRYFVIEDTNYTYECFLDQNIEASNNIANMETEERRYIAKFSINTLAKLVGGGANENKSVYKIYENAVDILLNREKSEIMSSQKQNVYDPTANTPFQSNLSNQETNVRTINGPVYGSIGGIRTNEYRLTVSGINTLDGVTRLEHNLHTKNIQVTIIDLDDDSNVYTTIYYYDNYINVENLIDGITYLFIITG
jgi:hypothetical protein